MVLSAKWSTEALGSMGGFLLIFFPEDDSSSSKKKTLLSLTSSSSSSSPIKSPSGNRRLSSSAFSGKILSKTQSILSICGLIVFTTFLLFTLTTFEPTTAANRHRIPRRILLSNENLQHGVYIRNSGDSVKALQGMGVLYRRGTRAMSDLVVAHVSDVVEEFEFRSFLRIVHNNGLLARSDLVFLFSSPSISSKFSPLIREENDSLLKLVLSLDELNRTNYHGSHGLAGLSRYTRTKKEEKKEAKEAIWGKGFRLTNYSDSDESTRPSYGSIVGFDASELDPDNSLSGFLDQVPMGLRRWACYPMLLGRVRRSYKHMALADVKSLLILNDPFTRVRNRSPESIFLWTNPDSDSIKKGKKQSSSPKDPTTNPGIVVGCSRGVRRLSDAVLTQIVRAVIEHKGKGKNSVTESGIVNQLVRSGHLLKNVNLASSPADTIPDTGEVYGSDPNLRSVFFFTGTVVQWEHSKSEISVNLRSLWCWSDLHSVVYSDCLATQ